MKRKLLSVSASYSTPLHGHTSTFISLCGKQRYKSLPRAGTCSSHCCPWASDASRALAPCLSTVYAHPFKMAQIFSCPLSICGANDHQSVCVWHIRCLYKELEFTLWINHLNWENCIYHLKYIFFCNNKIWNATELERAINILWGSILVFFGFNPFSHKSQKIATGAWSHHHSETSTQQHCHSKVFRKLCDIVGFQCWYALQYQRIPMWE